MYKNTHVTDNACQPLHALQVTKMSYLSSWPETAWKLQLQRNKKIPFSRAVPDPRPMSKVSGGLCSPAHTGKPGGSPRPQIKEQLQQLGEPSDSFQEGITFSKWEPQIWDAWLSASTPTSCSLTSPAYLSDHTFPAHGAWTFANRPYRQARWSPPSQVPARHFAGTHLTSTALFKDTAVCSPASGRGVFSQPPSSKNAHALMLTMPW